MENQIYRMTGSEKSKIEIHIVDTNEIEPPKDVKELAVTVLADNTQFDFDLETQAVKSLIKYLEESLEYIEDFNSKAPIKH